MTIPAFNEWDYYPKTGEFSGILPAEARDAMKSLQDKSIKSRGGYLSLTIDLPKRPRSTGPGSASNHFHGHVTQLSMAFGIPFETTKMYIKIRASLEMGYPAETIKGVTLPQSEALATVEQESMLIEMCHIVASEIPVSLIEEF
jgi:hypothetical protein